MNNLFNIVCVNCFKDKILHEVIISFDKKGNCPWCGSQDVNIIPFYELGDLFRDAAELYKQTGFTGDKISYLMQGDWDIFSDDIEKDPDLMQNLTAKILQSGIPNKELYSDYDDYFERDTSKLLDEWYYQADAYFSTQEDLLNFREYELEVFLDQFAAAFGYLSVGYEPGKIFYRARIHKNRLQTERFSLSELHAPKPKDTLTGRANLKGKPVLYLASKPQTAIFEVRPTRGAAVGVAKVEIKEKVRLVSLLKYELPESPFLNDSLIWMAQLAEFFNRLAEDLSTPIMPHEQEKLYRPTQFLCELIRVAHYNGVEYPSSSGIGHNIVLFRPEHAEPIGSKYVRIDDISITYSDLEEDEPVYDEGPYDYLLDSES